MSAALDPSYARMRRFAGFSREEFLSWLSWLKPGTSIGLELGKRETVYLDAKAPGRWAPSVMFVRRLVADWRKADVEKDYTRVTVYDVDGTLRTDAKTTADLAFIADLYPSAQKAVAKQLAKKTKRVKPVLLDRAALTEFISAATWGRAKVGPIVDQVLLSASNPSAYIAANQAACDEFSISEPVKGLHEVALQHHLPPALMVDFDWKESMHEVLPMLAVALESGPRLTLDVKSFATRIEQWDRAPREKALRAIAKTLRSVALVQVKVDADALVVVCIDSKLRPRVAEWGRRTKLKLAVL